MRERRYSTELCPRFQVAVDLLGKRWTTLVLHVLLDGPLRFGELADVLQVVSERMLSGPPIGVEYRLTRKGEALGRVLRGLERWADEWVEPPVAAQRRS